LQGPGRGRQRLQVEADQQGQRLLRRGRGRLRQEPPRRRRFRLHGRQPLVHAGGPGVVPGRRGRCAQAVQLLAQGARHLQREADHALDALAFPLDARRQAHGPVAQLELALV